ncbi:PepSY domain-containing protein [Streptococcus ictaluri]|uniref:Peptidase propeptide and YpeB domain protein n=1 Tax=Streptococcus ictaluri 707-05 TaxID=764299 RepID=G5K4B2_9STRE|nr:PepSY domain-containing protein [Streptococcus ictaluri]EHI69159.1 peptidase propeptide and YpeB domain protein [Streptococcus ictaluri 707-05]
MDKTKKAKVSEEEARSIALKDASVAEADAKMLNIKQDNDDGMMVYDVEFDHEDKEYSYTIDATSGDILEKSSEPIND